MYLLEGICLPGDYEAASSTACMTKWLPSQQACHCFDSVDPLWHSKE